MKKQILKAIGLAAVAALLFAACDNGLERSPNNNGDVAKFLERINSTDPCAANPTPACPNYCQVYPNAAQCQPEENCTTNPSMYGCPGFCTANPAHAECNTNPCVTNPYGYGCPQFCDANPAHAECNTDPCVTNPYAQGCPLYCDVNPTAYGCPGYCPSTTPGCPGYVDPDPCAGGVSAACCADNPSSSACATAKYCRWNNDPNDCWAISTLNADPEARTEANCRAAYGEIVNNRLQCSVLSNLQYCYWFSVRECYAITYPNDNDPNNPGMTFLENCRENGYLSQYSDCRDATLPAQYCDYGECIGGSGYSCSSGGCWPYKPAENCKPNDPYGRIVTSCPYYSKPPSAWW